MKTEIEIVNQGFKDFHVGLQCSENPYPEDSKEAEWWIEGWYQAYCS